MTDQVAPRGRGAAGLEWQIAWRHLRADETASWVRRVTWAAIYLLAIGGALWLYVTFGLGADAVGQGSAPPVIDPVLDARGSRLEQAFGLCAAVSLGLGVVLLMFTLLARMFSVLATIVIFEVVLGCMAMVVVLSLMSGLEGDLRDKILSQRAHMRVSRSDGQRLDDYLALAAAIEATEGVAGASPFLDGEVMVRSGLNRNAAVLYGVLPEKMADVSGLPNLMQFGSFDSLSNPESIPSFDPFAGSGLGIAGPTLIEDAKVERKPEPEPVDAGDDVTEADDGAADADDSDDSDDSDGADEADEADDEGWEDPVRVLKLDGVGEKDENETDADDDPPPRFDPAKLPPPPVFAPSVTAVVDGLDDEDDGGWEDPVEVLDLDPLPPEQSQSVDAEVEVEEAPVESEAIVDPILIGSELADELGVHIGARTQLITPVGRMTPAGRIPGVLATRVGGIFNTGMYEYDSKSVYAPLSVVQKFLRAGDRVSGIEIKLHDENDVVAGKRRIEATVAALGRDDELVVETWMDLNQNLFSAMFLEKLAMFIALSVVVVVASFGILASNLMSVLEKSSEIAVLKAMGATDRLIQRVYWAEGLCVGLVGAFAGIGLGLTICWVLQNYGMPGMQTGFYVEELPVTVSPLEVVAVGLVVMLIVWAFSLYPAFVASRMRPVDALRHAD